jgi:hypothetical protein
LEESLRTRDVFEAVLSKLAQGHPGWKILFDQFARGVGEEDLSTVRGSADPRRSMDRRPNVARVNGERLPSMEA